MFPTLHLDNLKSKANLLNNPVQVPWWDAPRWLLRSINLLKFISLSHIMPPRPINEYAFYSGHKDTLSPVIFRKIGGSYWNRLGLLFNFTTLAPEIPIKSSEMNTWYLVSLVTHLNWKTSYLSLSQQQSK